jgi:hypothetical protein
MVKTTKDKSYEWGVQRTKAPEKNPCIKQNILKLYFIYFKTCLLEEISIE